MNLLHGDNEMFLFKEMTMVLIFLFGSNLYGYFENNTSTQGLPINNVDLYQSREKNTLTNINDFYHSITKEQVGAKKNQVYVPVVDVTLFGALSNNFTDNLNAFQRALSYIKLISGGEGGILYVPPAFGEYKVSDSIEWDETYGHITILGEGRSSHVHLANKSKNGHLFGALGSSVSEDKWINGVTFKNIEVSTYEGSAFQDDNAIGVSKAKNILFENVYVSQSNWKGITVQGNAQNVTFRNVEAIKCRKYGLGVEFSTVKDVEVINSVTHHNMEQGAHFTNAGDNERLKGLNIYGLASYKNGAEGIGVSGAESPNLSGIDSHDNTGEGVKIYRTNNAKIKGKTLRNDLAGFRTILGQGHTVELDSQNNSLKDPNQRGNFFFESTPNCTLISIKGKRIIQDLTNWSSNLIVMVPSSKGTVNLKLNEEK